MSQNLKLPPAFQSKVLQFKFLQQSKVLQQAEAKARIQSQNRANARELLLRVQLILSRNQIK